MSVVVRWLDSFPKHWARVPAKRLFSESKARAPLDAEQLTASQDWGVIPQKEFIRRAGRRVVQLNQHLDKRKRVRRDDFVISMRSFQGGLERAWADGGIRSSYVVLERQPELDVGYYARLFKSTEYIQALQATAHFIRDGQDLNFQNFTLVDLPSPPLDEQTQIAKFLDYETAKIDKLIDKQQQLIALLKEKRQAVISHAVTKGLNPKAPLRDSGVQWLGKVPAHWEVLPLRRLLLSIEQGSSPQAADSPPGEREFGVLKLSAVKHGVFIENESKTLPRSTPFENRYRVRAGDLLITRGNTPELVADACLIRHEPKASLMMCDLVYRLTVNARVSAAYLCQSLLSSSFRAQIGLDARGSSMSMAKVSQGHIRGWLAAVPPRVEQDAVVQGLAARVSRIDLLLDACSEQTALLRERRTALISAAVTGKIDVRNWKPPSEAAHREVA